MPAYNHRMAGGTVIETTLTANFPGITWKGICSNGTDWVVCGFNGIDVVAGKSSDLINWTTSVVEFATPVSMGQPTAIASNGTNYVITMSGGTTAQPTTRGYMSTNGTTWTNVILPSGHWTDVTSNGANFVALSQSPFSAARTAISTTGSFWITNNLPSPSGDWKFITTDGTNFVTIADDSTVGAYSPNGSTWSQSTLPTSNWTGVTSNGTRFVAMTNSQVTAYSDNGGATWTQKDLQFPLVFTDIASNQDKFLAIAGTIYLISSDGLTWEIYSGNASIKISGKGFNYNNTGKIFGGITGASGIVKIRLS